MKLVAEQHGISRGKRPRYFLRNEEGVVTAVWYGDLPGEPVEVVINSPKPAEPPTSLSNEDTMKQILNILVDLADRVPKKRGRKPKHRAA